MLRRAMLSTLLVIAAAVGFGACGGDDSDTDQLSTATELADTWVEGWTRSDPELVASVFTDDGLYVSFTGSSSEGRDENAEYVRLKGSQIANVIRVGDVTQTPEGTYTWVIEGDLVGNRVRGTLEAELDGNLFARLTWAEDPARIE